MAKNDVLEKSVTYNSGEWQIGSGTSIPLNSDWYNSFYYHVWPNTVYQESKVDKAFEIISSLQESGKLKVNTVKQFIELVKLIEDVL